MQKRARLLQGNMWGTASDEALIKPIEPGLFISHLMLYKFYRLIYIYIYTLRMGFTEIREMYSLFYIATRCLSFRYIGRKNLKKNQWKEIEEARTVQYMVS